MPSTRHDLSVARVDAELVAAVQTRTTEIVMALDALRDDDLTAPSQLPSWSRLTIAAHLRYGAHAFGRITNGAVSGQAVAYYPKGRERQRPSTLRPGSDEAPHDVVQSLARCSAELHDAWQSLESEHWSLEVTEPDDNRDLGPLALSRLPLLRLTEVEVHGSDLGLGLNAWSDVFVAVALPFRLDWLNTRRTNHRAVDDSLEGAWLLTATDGPTFRVSTHDRTVESRPAEPTTPARAIIEASSRDLLALLLGRPLAAPPRILGDIAFGEAFSRAFPGP
jgi:uncharacterized protein (TIGR03083 family)